MGVHQSKVDQLAIPAELLHSILAALPKEDSEKKITICAARLVCRAWNRTLTAVLFQSAKFVLFDHGGRDGDQLHDLEALAELLETAPYLCSLVESLTLMDCSDDEEDDGESVADQPEDAAAIFADAGGDIDFGVLVGVDDQASLSGSDEDAGGANIGGDGDSTGIGEDVMDFDEGQFTFDEETSEYHDTRADIWSISLRCTLDPALLRRVLLYFSRLQNLSLQGILIPEMLRRDELDEALRAPLKVSKLLIGLPGWHAKIEHRDQVAYLMKSILTVFDSVDSLRLDIAWGQTYYTNIPENVLLEPEPLIPYQIHSFTATRTESVFLRALALNPAFSGLEYLRWDDVQAQNANAILNASGGTLSTLHLSLAEPHCEEDEEEPRPLDLSRCVALIDLTLAFSLYTHHPEREQTMSKYVNSTLRTLFSRATSASPIAKFTLWFQLGSHEPRRDGEWKLSPTSMHMLEDTLLELVDAGVCASVHVRFDLQLWYYMNGIQASPQWNVASTEQTMVDFQAKHRRNAMVCGMTLAKNLPRLRERRLVTIEEVPVTLNAYWEEEMKDHVWNW